MLFQYQGHAEPLLPPAGPDAWSYPPQVPVRRALAAAVAVFVTAPVLVPVDASQFQYPAQGPVQRIAAAREGYTLTEPVLVPQDAALFQYPAQVAVRAPRREQPDSGALPLLALGTDAALGYPAQVPGRVLRWVQPSGTVEPFPDLAPVVPFDAALLREYAPQFPRGWPGVAHWAPASFGPVMVIANVEVRTARRRTQQFTTTPAKGFSVRRTQQTTTKREEP